ncbi:hypothetical protein OG21DRAFT_1503028 [Imleria badia]|nr:hypothetical protein OG21DRAFT_1503028 [Imleria badia]
MPLGRPHRALFISRLMTRTFLPSPVNHRVLTPPFSILIMSSSSAVLKDPPSKAQPGASWKEKEQHVVPKNRLGIVFLGLMCSTFLAALDQVSLYRFRSYLATWPDVAYRLL